MQPIPPSGAQAPKSKVFVEGRYRKLTRDLPQTVFFCPECKGHPRRRKGCVRCEGFGKLSRDSVQELVGWVLGAAFKTRKNKFHGAGREDVNVRMLGEGRTFVVELLNPKCFEVDLAACEAEINRRNEGRLEVLGLHWTEKTRVAQIKEEQHAKEYRALVRSAAPLDPAKVAALAGQRHEIVQKTPSRVAHRRADLDRQRWIEVTKAELAAPAEDGTPQFELVVRAQHGTYVKEAISGEGGSTRPSISELVGSASECVELDVLAILGAEGEVKPTPPPQPSFGAFLDD